MIPKLSAACYTRIVRQMCYICNNDTLRSLYFAYFHSLVSCGIICWGNSSNSRKIFTLQKRIIRIMVGAHPKTSYRKLFKKLEILTFPSQYIYSLISFFIGNQEKFWTNSSVHSINPLPSLTLQSARNLNVPCQYKYLQSALVVLFVNLLRYVIETEALCCLT